MIVTGSLPFPFITKDGSLGSFKTVGTSEFNSDFNYGDVITGSYYPLTSSISSDYYTTGFATLRRKALKNTFNYYTSLSSHYTYSSSYGNKEVDPMRLISIPSIYYGQAIKKGSVELNFYVTGTLVGQLKDTRRNGELVQTAPSGSTGSGSIAGVVLYNEGFICLTGSWAIDSSHTEQYDLSNPPTNPAWLWFMTTGSSGFGTVASSSFSMDFQGTEKIPTVTMFAKAGKGEFNHSNNQTYLDYGQNVTPQSSSINYREQDNLTIRNIVDTIYDEEEPPFEKITYISKIAIYDENQNLIGVAKTAKPVRKRQNDNITFKLKLDM